MKHSIYILNGKLVEENTDFITVQNSTVFQGNVVFQKGIIAQSKWLFGDEIYFNLMASMRKMRMKIPMEFTIDYFQNSTSSAISPILFYQYKIMIFVVDEKVQHLISLKKIDRDELLNPKSIEIDVFKDFTILPTYLSAIPNSKPENIVAQQFAEDNDWDDVLFLTADLKVARSIQGNVYYFENGKLYTNDMETGAYRQAIDQALRSITEIEIITFSSFELQKADEVFILTENKGIIPIQKFRKKEYRIESSIELQNQLIQ